MKFGLCFPLNVFIWKDISAKQQYVCYHMNYIPVLHSGCRVLISLLNDGFSATDVVYRRTHDGCGEK